MQLNKIIYAQRTNKFQIEKPNTKITRRKKIKTAEFNVGYNIKDINYGPGSGGACL